MAIDERKLVSSLGGFIAWLRQRQIDGPIVIRLASQEDGLRFLHQVERESGGKVCLRPNLSWVDIGGIRFVWPMPELPDGLT